MKLPGFTAQQSLYLPSRIFYSGRSHYAGSNRRSVVPQVGGPQKSLETSAPSQKCHTALKKMASECHNSPISEACVKARAEVKQCCWSSKGWQHSYVIP